MPSNEDPLAGPSHPVTVGLCLLSGLVTAAYWAGYDIAPLLMTEGWLTQPWRVLTTTLPHGGIFHLGFNLYNFWILGGLVEDELGSSTTAWLCVVLAVVSSATEFALFGVGIGLSGIVYGVFGFLWLAGQRPDSPFYNRLPSSLKIVFVLWFLICIAATYNGSMPIANGAHGGGLLAGMLAGWAWAMPQRRTAARVAGWVSLVAFTALTLWGATAGRQTVNLNRLWQDDQHARRVEAIVHQAREVLADDPDLAAKMLGAALREQPQRALWWYLRGLAFERAGRHPEALSNYRQAAQLAPQQPQPHQGILRCLEAIGRSLRFAPSAKTPRAETPAAANESLGAGPEQTNPGYVEFP